MKRIDFGYFFREGLRGVFLHGFMSFAAVGVIVACLLIMGSVSLLAMNVDNIVMILENNNEIIAFIDEEYSDAEARSVSTAINTLPTVSECIFVSREQALKEYIETLGPDSAYFEGLDKNNPLRHRYRIMLYNIEDMESTAEQLRKIPGIARVNARVDIGEGIMDVRKTVETVSLILIVVLVLISAFIISNTVKLATFDRKEEIAIMRMVGATNSFIRWPFIVEGFILGISGAAISFFLQWGLYVYVTGDMGNEIGEDALGIAAIPFGDVFATILLTFLITGFLVGTAGSVLTIRKYLRV